MSLDDRTLGYKVGITNTGEWIRSRVIGLVHNDKYVFRGTVKLTNEHYLLYATKDEIDKLCKGELPD
jgi:hypothetical protein